MQPCAALYTVFPSRSFGGFMCRECGRPDNIDGDPSTWPRLWPSVSSLPQSQPHPNGAPAWPCAASPSPSSSGKDCRARWGLPPCVPQRYGEFWVLQNTFAARLYRSPLVTVAAIRGACPAAGCGIALCCDFRFMTDSGSIGLNEVALGIPVPLYWARAMERVVGPGAADKLLQFAVRAQVAAGSARLASVAACGAAWTLRLLRAAWSAHPPLLLYPVKKLQGVRCHPLQVPTQPPLPYSWLGRWKLWARVGARVSPLAVRHWGILSVLCRAALCPRG
jgi:Enoyl-CoA hydratase/isomerase